MDAKYIVIDCKGRELLFAFPESVAHVHMLEAVTNLKQGVPMNWTRPYRDSDIVSAGFISSDRVCYGKSESLGIASRGFADTVLLDRGLEQTAPSASDNKETT